VPTDREHLKYWEKAFVGEAPLFATAVFWQCAVGLAYALSQIYFAAAQLHSRSPILYTHSWIAFPLLMIFVLYLFWNFLAKASKIKTLLKQDKTQPAYDDNLVSAKSSALNFFLQMMGLGIAILITRAIFMKS
jgi:putative Mn2+ efflux pump MntP